MKKLRMPKRRSPTRVTHLYCAERKSPELAHPVDVTPGESGRRGATALVKLDQILEDQLSPSRSASLYELATLSKLAEHDRCEAKLLN